jgi:hypothetical protein
MVGRLSKVDVMEWPGPDVAIPSVESLDSSLDFFSGLQKTVVGQGYGPTVNVIAANGGNCPETFNVTVYAGTTYVTSQNVTLSNGTSAWLSIPWNTTSTAYGYYTIWAYASPVPGQTNTANNNCTGCTVTVTIPGDINGDGKVNLQDLVLLTKAYGSKPGDSNWNPNADIKGDGIVDLPDLVVLAHYYNQQAANFP